MFFIKLFLDFSAWNLKCYPESLWTITTSPIFHLWSPQEHTKRAGWLSFIVSQMGYEDHKAKWLSVAQDDRWQSCGQNSQLLILCSPLSPPHVQPLKWPPLMPLSQKGHFAFVSCQSSCLGEAHLSEIFLRFTDFLNLNTPEQGMDSFIKKSISPWFLYLDMLFKICTK